MIIEVVSIAFNSGSGLIRLADSARISRHRVRLRVFLHSRHVPTMQACETLASRPDMTCYAYGENRGVSRSWNEGMLDAFASGADAVVIANDDVAFSPFDIDKLAEKAAAHPDCYIVTCAGPHGHHGRRLPSHGYACFAINPIALRRIGCFDENIFPAYCEDQDYAYRSKLAGLSEENCPDTEVYHEGSATIFSDPVLRDQNGRTHGRNMQYYRAKWGGDGGHETFVHPFNDARFDFQIAPDQRHQPYGADYDRTSRELAKAEYAG